MTGAAGRVRRAAQPTARRTTPRCAALHTVVRAGSLGVAVCALMVFSLTGCGAPGVEDICKQLEEQGCSVWSGVEECKADGERLQARVDQQGGCDGAYDDYRRCLWDAASCSWASECADTRAELESCIGEL